MLTGLQQAARMQNKDAYTVVDSKNTVILFVDSDAGKGETGYTMADIDLARTFDSDFWSKGKLPAINDIQDLR